MRAQSRALTLQQSRRDRRHSTPGSRTRGGKEEEGKNSDHNPFEASGASPEPGRPAEEEASGAGEGRALGVRNDCWVVVEGMGFEYVMQSWNPRK